MINCGNFIIIVYVVSGQELFWPNVIYYPISSNENFGMNSPSSLIVPKKKKEVIGLGANYVGTRGIFVPYFKWLFRFESHMEEFTFRCKLFMVYG